MQLLCSTGAFSRNPDYTSHRQVLEHAQHLHVDGFELMFYTHWYQQLDQITRELQQSGLHFPAMHTEKNIGMAFGSAQPEVRAQAVEWLTANCQLASNLGTSLLVLHLWGWPELDDHLEYNLEPLNTCLDRAAAYGVQLAIETIPARHADPLTNVARAIERDPRCAIALDTEFLAQSEQLATVFDTPRVWQDGRVRHVHIKDFDGQGFSATGKRRYLHPLEGNVDFPRFFANLKQHAFNGYISLEAPAIDDAGQVDVQRINQSLDYIRGLIESNES